MQVGCSSKCALFAFLSFIGIRITHVQEKGLTHRVGYSIFTSVILKSLLLHPNHQKLIIKKYMYKNQL